MAIGKRRYNESNCEIFWTFILVIPGLGWEHLKRLSDQLFVAVATLSVDEVGANTLNGNDSSCLNIIFAPNRSLCSRRMSNEIICSDLNIVIADVLIL